ncbi:hypothetical protein GCM10010520_05330 [Rhizobium viscosum]|uniref:Uncharacterized protein n=1 Tax=Rhizobium viscosum TaxID=1673 RepID=A0ABR9ILQ9_RHIVS|nr:hypothetical protein [Rhizobium viscosum]MBE1504120.1 hypothetical protein [Rhizobium viscosum]
MLHTSLDWLSNNAAVVAAIVAAFISLITSFITSRVALASIKRKAEFDFRTEFSAERAIIALLMIETQSTRTWNIIRETIGGFGDDELKKLLVRSGAIRMIGPNQEERWGLLDRNRDFLIKNRFLREHNRNPDWYQDLKKRDAEAAADEAKNARAAAQSAKKPSKIREFLTSFTIH